MIVEVLEAIEGANLYIELIGILAGRLGLSTEVDDYEAEAHQHHQSQSQHSSHDSPPLFSLLAGADLKQRILRRLELISDITYVILSDIPSLSSDNDTDDEHRHSILSDILLRKESSSTATMMIEPVAKSCQKMLICERFRAFLMIPMMKIPMMV